MIAKGSRRSPFPPGTGHHQHGSRLSEFGRWEAGHGRSPAFRRPQSRYACVEIVVMGGALAPTPSFETDLNGNLALAVAPGRTAEDHRGGCKWIVVDGELAQP